MSARVERAARAAAGRVAESLAVRLREALPDAEISVGNDGVEIAAPGLTWRWIADPTLRWPGAMLR